MAHISTSARSTNLDSMSGGARTCCETTSCRSSSSQCWATWSFEDYSRRFHQTASLWSRVLPSVVLWTAYCHFYQFFACSPTSLECFEYCTSSWFGHLPKCLSRIFVDNFDSDLVICCSSTYIGSGTSTFHSPESLGWWPLWNSCWSCTAFRLRNNRPCSCSFWSRSIPWFWGSMTLPPSVRLTFCPQGSFIAFWLLFITKFLFITGSASLQLGS